MRRRWIAVAAAAVVSAAVGAGCGGDGDEPATVTETVGTTSEEPLSKAEYIAASDEICAESAPKEDEFRERYEAAEDRDDTEAAADIVRELVELGEEITSRRQALVPPTGDQDLIEELFELQEQVTGLARSLETAIRDEDFSRSTELGEELVTVSAERDALAKGYGFRVCSQDTDLGSRPRVRAQLDSAGLA